MDAFDISASGLSAQRMRLDVISSNLANVNTTRRPDGTLGAYHRKNVQFAPLMSQVQEAFENGNWQVVKGANGRPMLSASVEAQHMQTPGVQVLNITDDTQTPLRKVYDPSHPDANEQGYVDLPNVNVVTEMVDMLSATRAYEANVTAMQSAKQMHQSALEI